ncbi:unnamed protein product [Urochloa decumbens]|uniref:Uncharacterized protein n=1 Tax=Urochloa decumbens TaxID=240449 RepID=A0ABC9C9U4_9POAL
MAATVAAVMPAGSVDLDDFNIDDFDVDFDFDFDLGDLAADEFCDAYSAFLANADAKRVGGGADTGGWIGDLCSGGGEGISSSREGSPDSVVTDGPLAGDEDDVSAFVAELEQFLMEDGDAAGPGGDRAEEDLVCADDFFADLFDDDDFNCFVKAAAGALHDGDEEEEIGDGDVVLAAREEDDEPTSRKRARHKIKGTTMTPWWGELEVSRRHLARIQHWPPAAAAVLLCCV